MNPILDVYPALKVFVDTDSSSAISSVTELQQQAARIFIDARIKELKLIQSCNEARILSVPGVRGVGIGADEQELVLC